MYSQNHLVNWLLQEKRWQSPKGVLYIGDRHVFLSYHKR
jgi:hypothetical protein